MQALHEYVTPASSCEEALRRSVCTLSAHLHYLYPLCVPLLLSSLFLGLSCTCYFSSPAPRVTRSTWCRWSNTGYVLLAFASLFLSASAALPRGFALGGPLRAWVGFAWSSLSRCHALGGSCSLPSARLRGFVFLASSRALWVSSLVLPLHGAGPAAPTGCLCSR